MTVSCDGLTHRCAGTFKSIVDGISWVYTACLETPLNRHATVLTRAPVDCLVCLVCLVDESKG